ncbi:hypothetical protein LP419_37665 [Massilia sp. H-1]|nr:hypothetical protein LP419_37665 [Massilia sp. H-1]
MFVAIVSGIVVSGVGRPLHCWRSAGNDAELAALDPDRLIGFDHHEADRAQRRTGGNRDDDLLALDVALFSLLAFAIPVPAMLKLLSTGESQRGKDLAQRELDLVGLVARDVDHA